LLSLQIAVLQLMCALLGSCGPFLVYVFIVVFRFMYAGMQCDTVVGTHISEGHCSVVLWVMTPCCSLHSWRWEHVLLKHWCQVAWLQCCNTGDHSM